MAASFYSFFWGSDMITKKRSQLFTINILQWSVFIYNLPMNYPYVAQCPSCYADADLTQADIEKKEGDIVCKNCNNQFYAPNHLLKGFYAPRAKADSGKAIKDEKSASKDKMEPMDADDIMLPPSTKYSEYKRRQFLKRSGLIFGNLCLVVFLLFQLLWLNFDKWATRESLRPIYSFLCSIESLSCQLPAWVEPDRLSLQDFQVDLREDSTYVIQARLVNRDNRAQAFPWVNIIFSDINGIVIASGRFSPYQYLAPDVTDSLMGAANSYDILLEIQKPSHPVVSYEMRLVAAAP